MKKKQLQLVTYEQAKKLKALGFDWKLSGCYFFDGEFEEYDFTENFNDPECDVLEMDCEEPSECFSAPTVALALKWFRDEKGVSCAVNYWDVVSPKYEPCFSVARKVNRNLGSYKIYEEAEIALLDELLKL